MEHFCMFSLSTFQSKGYTLTFLLKNIQKDVTVTSDLDTRIQKVAFAKVFLGNLDKSTLIEFLPDLVNQDSKSFVKDILHGFQEWTVCFK